MNESSALNSTIQAQAVNHYKHEQQQQNRRGRTDN